MNVRFLIFISIVVGVLSSAAYYVGARFIVHSAWASNHAEAVWLSLGIFIVLQILGPFLYRLAPDRENRLFIVHWVVYVALGTFACVFFYTAVADLLALAGRVFERWAFVIMATLTTVSVVVGVFQAARGPKVYEVRIPIENLPSAFDGFRIVQVSDLHIGPTIGRAYAEKVVSMANGLSPDAVALTGDFIDGTVTRLRSAVEPLKNLRAAHGVFYVTGNHEYYWGAREWVEEFKKLGARVLLNEHVMIRKGGDEIVLAGVADEEAGGIVPEHASDPAKAVAGSPPEAVKILLAHRPSRYKEAAKEGFSLQLSGHTHGGQFFPWSLIVGMAYKFSKGLHRFENLWVYVSRGTGYWGPPIRFGVPGEVTVLTLKKS